VILRFAENPVSNYLASTPLALALERALECLLLSKQQFAAPVLDIGCGDGLFARILFTDKIDTGIDLNPSEIACAAKTGAYHELICCSGSQIPKASGTYRTVFSNSVLEHIPDLTPVLEEAHRLLEPGGSFLFTVPTDEFEQHALIHRLLMGYGLTTLAVRFRKWYNRFWRHFHAYNTSHWKKLAEDAGFEVEEMVRYNPPGMTTRNDCLSPVAALASILKRTTGHWVLWPKLRQILFGPIASKIERNLAQEGVSADGSLVLVRARKVLENPA
jgi:2-polyprenyl-3-methyl-5-hydroxy-6-metoxy-1,4-benzoquinol methylase